MFLSTNICSQHKKVFGRIYLASLVYKHCYVLKHLEMILLSLKFAVDISIFSEVGEVAVSSEADFLFVLLCSHQQIP